MSNYSLSELFEEKKEIRELFFEFMKEQVTRFIKTLSVAERDAYYEKTGDSKWNCYLNNEILPSKVHACPKSLC